MPASIISIVGNRRPNNYTAFATSVVNTALIAGGASVRVFDGRELTLGFPGEPSSADAIAMRESVAAADAIVLATPEYHGTFSAYMKLIIENLDYPSVLAGKPVALIGVASGRIGAVKSLEALRICCAHCGAIVMPHPISVAGVRQAFNEEGGCTNPGAETALVGLADDLLSFLKRYRQS